MRNNNNWMLSLACLFAIFSCQSPKTDLQMPISIIPAPNKITSGVGYYEITPNLKINLVNEAKEIADVLNVFQDRLQQSAGFKLEVETKSFEQGGIHVMLGDLPKEGYNLDVNDNGITITGGSKEGVFYAFQSLLQLLPEDVYGKSVKSDIGLRVPVVNIQDAPRFEYRGMHLDVGRHMFPIEYIKQYIDYLAMHKMNRFHWHLTEDQGWRIEIKKYPKLQTIAAYRNETMVGHFSDNPRTFSGEKYGGFYTQEEAKEIVQYAADRNIIVIPEIEMPGHAQAAIAAYPELGCTNKEVEPLMIWGVSEEVYCPNEKTFKFLENVIDEVLEIFPSEYIHIGGDECPKNRWRESTFCQNLIKQNDLKDEHGLQSYFIQRMEKYINSKGRKIIGWDEILEGGLAPNAAVMSWRGISGGIEAAKMGHEVIMTPTSHMYFDYYQSSHPKEPLAIGGLLTLEKVYSYDPIPEELTNAEAKFVIGVQGNLWTEYVATAEKANYMVLPRMSGVAEVAWTELENKDWASFKDRMKRQFTRFDAMGVDYSKALLEPALKKRILADGQLEVELFSAFPEIDLYYTTDGKMPSTESKQYLNPIKLNTESNFVAAAIENGNRVAHEVTVSFNPHLATGKTITTEPAANEKFPGEQGALTLVDGIRGSQKFDGIHWLAWDGEDLEIKIDLTEATDIQSVEVGCLKSNGAWIHLPKQIILKAGNDLNALKEVARLDIDAIDKMYPKVQISDMKTTARYVVLEIKHQDKIPVGLPGQDNAAWVFLDEIIIR